MEKRTICAFCFFCLAWGCSSNAPDQPEASTGGGSSELGSGGGVVSSGGNVASGGVQSGGSVAAGGASDGGGEASGGQGVGGEGGNTNSGGAGGGEDVASHREIRLTIDYTLGFDDSSPGADLAIAIDESAGMALIVALKFETPFSSGEFAVSGDPVEVAGDYFIAPAIDQIAEAVAAYPVLGAGITDVAGIRSMNGDVTAILLEGSLQAETPGRTYVAHAGSVTLYRNDGPYDLEGALSFTEVSTLGSLASSVPDPKTIDVTNFYFEYDTGFF